MTPNGGRIRQAAAGVSAPCGTSTEEVTAMPQVPNSLSGLLSLLAPCFTQPTFQTFSLLLVGFIARIRENTVCGMLQAAGLAGVWHHSRAHAFFAYRRWAPDELGLRLCELLVSVLLTHEEPIRLAVDDTLFGRSGRQVYGAHYLHDGSQPEGSGHRTRWGNCWVVVVLVVALPCTGGRMVGLPILFRLFRPKDEAHPDRPSQSELARPLIDMLIKRFPGRKIELVADGAYATRAWQGLPENVSLTTRMRANAAIYELPPQPDPSRKGRHPLKGARMRSLAEIAKSASFTQVSLTGRDGRERTTLVHEFTCLWYKPFHTQPIKVLLVRNPARSEEGFDIAIASTDTTASASELIARYDGRWVIETVHQEAKNHGVGDARNRVKLAVERTVPFGFLAMTITIAWYQLCGDPQADVQARRRQAPWYRQKTSVSYADMLAALRRELIRQEFHTQGHSITTNTQITEPQYPPLIAAA
ncbi:MAG: IS701 family transposase [Steroidobacteraceae bacterium]